MITEKILDEIVIDGFMTVCDPSYDPVNGTFVAKLECIPGTYICKVFYGDYDELDTRVAAIMVIHRDYMNETFMLSKVKELAVDSGQMGVYDTKKIESVKYDDTKKILYDAICSVTSSDEMCGAI